MPWWKIYEWFNWYFNGTSTESKLIMPRSWPIPFLMLLSFLILSPTPNPIFPGHSIISMIVGVSAVVALSWGIGSFVPLIRRMYAWQLFGLQFACVAIFAGCFLWIVYFTGYLDEPQESISGTSVRFFPHLWHPVAFLVLLVALFAPLLARQVTGSLGNKLTTVDVSDALGVLYARANNPPPPPSGIGNTLAALTATLISPVEWLFLPAAWLVFWEEAQFGPWFYYIVAVLLGLASFLAVFFAEWKSWICLRDMRSFVKRAAWYGGTWATSVAVIGLAAAGLFDFSYVKTVMEGSRDIIVFPLLATCALFWIFHFWVNRFLCGELLKAFGNPHGKAFVQVHEWNVCIHGTAQLSILPNGDLPPLGERPTFDRTDLFDELLDIMVSRAEPEDVEPSRQRDACPVCIAASRLISSF